MELAVALRRGSALPLTGMRLLPFLRRRRSFASIGSLALMLFACAKSDLNLSARDSAVFGAKPATVRVEAVATSEFRYSSRTMENLALAFREAGLEADSKEYGSGELSVATGAGGSGSGFVIRSDGYVITSAHLIEPLIDQRQLDRSLIRNGAIAALRRHFSESLLSSLKREDELEPVIEVLTRRGALVGTKVTREVEFSNGLRAPFALIRYSPPLDRRGSDLALLKVNRANLPVASLGDSARVMLGEHVVAIGYPAIASTRDDSIGGWLASESDLEATVQEGSITALKKSAAKLPIFQSDATISPGGSGGPVLNQEGEVVAVATSGLRDQAKVRFFVTAQSVILLTNSAGVRLASPPGAFDLLWRNAIAEARGGDWIAAARDAKLARALFAGSPDVDRLIQEAERRIPQMPFWQRHPYFALTFAIAILLLLAAIVTAFRVPREVEHDTSEVEFVQPSRQRESKGGGLLGRFTFLNGTRSGERLGLGGSGIRIGRESTMCEIVLENPKVSRLHAEVVEVEGKVLLIDRNSSNGTYVNDRRIDRHYLHDGDIIYFGGRNAVAVAFHS